MSETNIMESWKQSEIKKMREQIRKYLEFQYWDLLLSEIEKNKK